MEMDGVMKEIELIKQEKEAEERRIKNGGVDYGWVMPESTCRLWNGNNFFGHVVVIVGTLLCYKK